MARATLFERLTERDLDSGVGQLRRSIGRNLAALLNTRTGPGAIVEYGLPDLAEFYAGNERDRGRLEELIAARVERYEPRLKAVRVTLRQDRLNPRGLSGSIEARLTQAETRETLSFPIALLEGALQEKPSECKTPNPFFGTTPTS